MESKKADISKQQMLEDGWNETGDPVYLLEKSIENRNPINNSEDSEIKLVLHGMYNQWTFAVALPDGGMLNFVANSMDELKRFEQQLAFYDPPF